MYCRTKNMGLETIQNELSDPFFWHPIGIRSNTDILTVPITVSLKPGATPLYQVQHGPEGKRKPRVAGQTRLDSARDHECTALSPTPEDAYAANEHFMAWVALYDPYPG